MLTLTVLLHCLSSAIREALLQALNECAQHQIAQVQVSHLFLQLLKQPEPNELIFLLDRYDISVLELRRQLNTALLSVHIQSHSTLVLSEALIILLQQAWQFSRTEQCPQINIFHLLQALMNTDILLCQKACSPVIDQFKRSEILNSHLTIIPA